MNIESNRPRLEELAALAAAWPLECDGTTRCLATVLKRHNQAFSVAGGQLDVEGVGYIAPHWWIELADGRILDVKARLWLDDERAPHGVIVPSNGFTYKKLRTENTDGWVMPDFLFSILAGVELTEYDGLFSK